MSSSYESSRSRRRGLWSFWVPVVVTVTVATAGVAAWAWSQREDDEESEHENEAGLDYENADYGENPAYGALKDAESASLSRGVTYGITEPPAEVTGASAGWGAQMSGALRRTPSPQQFLTDAGKRVAASVAGVGAAVGSALAAIREEDKNAYADHETWSEEAEARKERPSAPSQSQSRDASKRRKTVAIVVSADTNVGELEGNGIHEHASILSHIPRNTDFSKIKLFVLIYSPALKDAALEAPATANMAPPSLSSSFSNIGHEQAQTPGSETKSPILK
ncbi:putative peroxin 22-like protein [Eutypa lata UCREL1]|uniref:Putative peroxin 22-like protein n=1 Tax=Eutypa lata (strain UCR-EL1) TaxID=1287681 RepID=M7T709_EUTLA|nr:putative peroxin 22-like protein [Eutypa lata UCREL1]